MVQAVDKHDYYINTGNTLDQSLIVCF